MLAKVGHRGLGILQQADGGAGDLTHIVRWDIRGHAHGNAGGAVEQYVGQARRKQLRFVQGTVEVRPPVHGALSQFREQYLGIGRQPRLGVTHGGEGLGIVGRTPVALTVHQRVTVGEGLGHVHHGLVAGAVAVGMELAQHVTDGARRFLELGACRQAQFGHGIDDAPLHRLEAITDVRQGAVEDDVHGVIQVRLFGKGAQRQALHAFIVHFILVHDNLPGKSGGDAAGLYGGLAGVPAWHWSGSASVGAASGREPVGET